MSLDTIDPPILAPGSRLSVMTECSFSDEAARLLRDENSPDICIEYADKIKRRDGDDTKVKGVLNEVMGQGMYGLLPMKNSSTGVVVPHLDILRTKSVGIVGEVNLNVRMHAGGVLGTRLDQVTNVHSHLAGLGQSKRFIETELPPNVIQHTEDNTSIAMRKVAELGRTDAIALGSELAIRHYGLETIARDIANLKGDRNITQFYVIEPNGHRDLPDPHKEFHAAIIRPREYLGVLRDILGLIKGNRINLTSLHSFKEDERDPIYSFFLEMYNEGDAADLKLLDEQLHEYGVLESMHWLGSWNERVYSGKGLLTEQLPPLAPDPALHKDLDLSLPYHNVLLRPQNYAGALFDLLRTFAHANVNLTALHSHTEGPNEYSFTVGLDSTTSTRRKMELVLRQLQQTRTLHSVEFRGSSETPVE